MLDRIFDMNNPFFRFMNRVADLLLLNILFIVTSLPVITIGASATALNYVCLKMKEQEEGYIIKNFFKSFKANFRQSTILWLIQLALGLVLALELYLYWGIDTPAAAVIRTLVYTLIVLYIMFFMMIFALQSRFYNTVIKTIRNGILLTFANAPRVIAMLGFLIGVLYMCTATKNSAVRSYGLLYWLMLGFAVQAYVNATMLQPVFKKLMPEETEEPQTPDHAFTVDEEADLSALGYSQGEESGKKQE